MGQPKYFTRDGASAAEHIPLRDPTSIGASYDRYLQTAVAYSYVLFRSSQCKSSSCVLISFHACNFAAKAFLWFWRVG